MQTNEYEDIQKYLHTDRQLCRQTCRLTFLKTDKQKDMQKKACEKTEMHINIKIYKHACRQQICRQQICRQICTG